MATGDAAFSRPGHPSSASFSFSSSSSSQAAPPPSGPTSAPPSRYFSELKKGEVEELLAGLREASAERDMVKQREVVKRVIAFMTVGIDLSRLFPEMIMSCNTRDVVQKKLVYLYLTTYAESHPDLSLLAVNTLQKDVTDTNPMIRGLALRALCSLRLPHFLEYMIPPVDNGLRDPAPYVRKTAALAVAKLHRLSPQFLQRQTGWVNTLYDLVADRDTVVAHNALAALEEVLSTSGGPSVTRTLAMHLYSRIGDFNPWAMCLVLQMALRHSPTEDDLYDILNVLEDRLKHNNPATIFTVLQAFLRLTEGLPICEEVYSRLVGPLIMVLSSAGPEEAWTSLHHARLLATVVPHHFAAHYKHFYCRYNDTSAVKVLKVDILTDIASESSAQPIVEELSEYIREGDSELGKRAVAAIGRIAASVPQAEPSAVFVAQELLGSAAHGGDGSWVGLGLSLALALLRHSPSHADTLLPSILSATSAAEVEDTEARSAYVWVVGEYGERINEAPYLLERLVPTYAELPASLKLQLLSAAMKLLFKRAPEMQPVIGSLLRTALDDSSNVDVRDRALLYYRLLRQHFPQARQIFSGEKEPIGAFAEETNTELDEELLAEFNSLAVVYGVPSHRFPRPPVFETRPPSAEPSATSSTASVEQDDKPAAPFTTAVKAQSLLGEEGPLVLRPRPVMDSQAFQTKWAALPVAQTWEAPLSASADWSGVEARMNGEHIMCMASGSVGGIYKYYFYAQEDRSSAYLVVEVVGDVSKNRLTARFKTESERVLPHFTRHFKLALSSSVAVGPFPVS